MNDLVLPVVGNLTDAPELTRTTQGTQKVTFAVAHTPRVRDAQSGTFKDGETTYMPCEAWGSLAQNIADSLPKGTRVVVVGELKTTRWTDKTSGQAKSRMVLTVTACGPDLSYATAKVEKARRS